jgi:hypothetical protein
MRLTRYVAKPVSAGAALFGLGMFVATEYAIRLGLDSVASVTQPEWFEAVAQLNFIAIVLVAVGGVGWMALDALDRGVRSWVGELEPADD